MSGDVDGEGAQILTDLDAVGNTTKAITKGIAIATAVLAATALFGSFTDAWRSAVSALVAGNQVTQEPSAFSQATLSMDIVSPNVLVGALLGAAVVFLFSGLSQLPPQVNGIFTAENCYPQSAARHGPTPYRSASCARLLRRAAEGDPDGSQASIEVGSTARGGHLVDRRYRIFPLP